MAQYILDHQKLKVKMGPGRCNFVKIRKCPGLDGTVPCVVCASFPTKFSDRNL